MPCVKITPSTGQVITLAEAKRHLRIDLDLVDEENDADIQDLILDAQAAAEDRIGRSLLPTTWLATFAGFQAGRLVLQRPPVIVVASVKYLDPAGVLQTLPPATYAVDTAAAPGQLLLAPGGSWPATVCQANAVQVTYTAGYADPEAVPRPIARWIKLALGDLYTQRARSSERAILPNDFADSLLDEYKVWTL